MTDSITMVAEKCMEAVREHVGTVELEVFIYYIRSQAFDYTKWQQEHFDSKTPEEIYALLETYSQQHSFNGKKAVVI